MAIKRRRGVLETGLMGQIEYAVMCDRCSLVISGWQHDCQKALDLCSKSGWVLADDDHSGDLCEDCAVGVYQGVQDG
jgi:hypothetical protein